MKFGYQHASFAGDGPLVDELVERAQLAEELGYEWFSLIDHLWQLPGIGERSDRFVDCYSGLNALAPVKESMELGALVTCVHYRHPAYLARVLASLDALSGGRAVLGIGAGWNDPEYEAWGMEFPDAPTRVSQLEDAIRLCDAAWERESPVDYDGEHYELNGLYCDPKPDVPVLVGGGGEQLTLRVTAEHADRWNVPGTDPDTYAHKLDVLEEHCEAVGRDYGDIEKTVLLQACVRDTTEAAHDAYERLLAETEQEPPDRDAFRGLVGTPAEVGERVDRYAEMGVDMVMVEVPRNDEETLRRVGELA
jgi:alkanesulfonate monooxygenase SsuD/methylene tetrahydromethanopterin reductase-like flavin-dependent oxidoreductase (luciferase family)